MKAVMLAAAVALLGACGGGDSSLTIRNSSSFAIIEINLSSVDDADWGPDLLGAEILEPGDVLELSEIDCGDYDIRIIDEDGDECVLSAVELCFNDAVWNITDTDLAVCVAF
jgi:hypothetical protein